MRNLSQLLCNGSAIALTPQDIEILPIAALYGGNASGKTNLFLGLNFVKNLVVLGTRPDELIPIEPFLLDQPSKNSPSIFAISILVDEKIYEYSFSASNKEIIYEKLAIITEGKEELLYHRSNKKLVLPDKCRSEQFLNFAFKGTRDNQLFLTNSVSLNIDDYRPVYNWFKNNLVLIAPDSRFASIGHLFDSQHKNYMLINEFLPKLDTGISKLSDEEIPIESLRFPPYMLNEIEKKVSENNLIGLIKSHQFNPYDKETILIKKTNGKIIAKKLIAIHKSIEGNDVTFSMNQESDGTLRLIDILPAFIEISSIDSKSVIVADELDRNVHPMLIRKLIESYLYKCSPNNRAQLLFTTHNMHYMDQNLFRRDEMWVAERNMNNISKIYSFSEFDIRADKDIQKSYRQNRLGGTPNILLDESDFFNNQASH